ncbi:MAG: integrin alpha [Planctomycetota bacterium]
MKPTPALLACLTLAAAASAQTELYTKKGLIHGAFGWSARMISDVDNDGHADLVVGAPWSDDDAGRAFVLSGFDGSNLHKFFGDAFPNRLGESVTGVGDVSGDGVEDLLVGAINRAGLTSFAGYARLYSGDDGVELREHQGGGPGDSFGYAVTGVGDLDQDGTPDYAISATEIWLGGNGTVRVYSGASGAEILGIEGLGSLDQFGYAVDSAGDFDLDGTPDLIVGGPEFLAPTIGYAVVVSGQEALDFGNPLIQLSSPAVIASDIVALTLPGDDLDGAFGSSVCVIDDVNDDGTPDVLVGSPLDDAGGTFSGSADVYSGADGTLIRTHENGNNFDQYGHSVAFAGDVDGDDVPDYIVGAKQSEGWGFHPEVGYGDGYADVRSGATGDVLFSLTGPSYGSLFGFVVRGGGDVNGDGAPDFLATAPWDDGMNGAITLYSGIAAISDYGGGCAGSGGVVPELAMSCSPVPGGPLQLEVSGGLGGSLALVLLGTGAGDLPLLGGCSLLVAPVPVQPTVSAPLAGVAAGEGACTIDAVLPDSAVPGLTLSFQTVVLDPGVGQGFSATNGCLLTIP